MLPNSLNLRPAKYNYAIQYLYYYSQWRSLLPKLFATFHTITTKYILSQMSGSTPYICLEMKMLAYMHMYGIGARARNLKHSPANAIYSEKWASLVYCKATQNLPNLLFSWVIPPQKCPFLSSFLFFFLSFFSVSHNSITKAYKNIDSSAALACLVRLRVLYWPGISLFWPLNHWWGF